LSNRSFKIICIELIHLLGRILRDMNLTSEPKSYDPMDAYDRINRFDTMEALKAWLIEKFAEVIHFIRLAGCHERHSPVVSKALSYIQAHFNQPITLSEAAESAGVSHTYLSRAFKEEIGKGFNEYLTHYRIEHACQLISSGGMRLKDVATACGFSQYTYFFKVFKQTTGLTPNEYWNQKLQ
ncbi:MAG: AraC family transcriptional regulator, partial [Eubacteriales bacterium]|nr:AraC family transcriptional regulator [Eubacteriales bacterium]